MAEQTDSFRNHLQNQLARIEKRDWELSMLAMGMLAVLAVGYFLVIFPTVFLGQRGFYIQAQMSAPLLIGQLALVLLFLIYLVRKHIQVRSARAESIVSAINFQISHAQLLMDPLTRVFNRSALEEVIGKEISRAQRKQTSLVFLYADIDAFKQVNTLFGHLSGDLVLAETGGILKSCVRGSDYVIRIGGDEFLVLLIDTNKDGAEVVKERMNQRARRWNESSPLTGYTLSLSIGIEEFDHSRTLDEALAAADASMYAEKHARGALGASTPR